MAAAPTVLELKAPADGLATLGHITGLGRAAVVNLLEEIRVNLAKLDGCPGPHEFEVYTPPDGIIVATCGRCGGTIGMVELGWYRRGMEDGPLVAKLAARR